MPTNVVQFVLGIASQLFFPYQSLIHPVDSVLNATPGKELDDAINKWKKTTLYELNFIGIVVNPGSYL
jgi:hypothetical protein